MYKVSVVVPTKNGGALFEKVLSKVLEQEFDGLFEVVIVDSGSSDGTVSYVKRHSGVKLIQIPPEEFGHGKTRNLGALNSSGEFIVFITQDALPFDDNWLTNLISPFYLDDEVMGVFGKHLPYEDCDIFEKDALKRHFENFGSETVLYALDDRSRYESDEAYRHFLGFYSDNCSAMRRSMWELLPYADVNFAEDQIWAKEIIERGYKKAYAPNAIVYHSHRYKFREQFKRYYDEYKGLYEIYQYKPVKNIAYLPPRIIKHSISDFQFVKTHKLPKKDMLGWIFYSVIKNINRYFGGYLGAREQHSTWLNKMFSREYKIIHEGKSKI